MKRNTVSVVAVVALVALAGCTGFAPSATPGSGPATDAPEDGETTEPTDDDGEIDGETDGYASDGVVRFYISDEKNAIGDFEHLNVTITEVGFRTAGDAAEESDDEEDPGETPENETETSDVEDGTDAPEDNGTEVPEDDETEIPEDNGTEVPEDEDEEREDDEADDESDDGDEADEEDESGEWVEYEVDDRTVDLTRLQGDNATLLSEFDVPAGSYSKVFVHVDGIEATLRNGESVNVKLPSEKLQITEDFDVEANSSVDFVFDITVHKAGNSGKYILTPVISESGTDVPIEDVDDEREDAEDERDEDAGDERDEESEESEESEEGEESEEDEERDGDERDEDDESEESDAPGETPGDEPGDAETVLNATFVGPVEAGSNVTVRVSANGSAVANATVELDGDPVGVTDETGQLTFAVPEDAEEIEVTVESGDAEAELEAAFEDAPPA